MTIHLVWDWNGTLLDDLAVVVQSVNAGLADYGVEPIDADGYRTHYTRPVKTFYDRLLGRPVSDEEWPHINGVFHDVYFEMMTGVGLTADALQAIELAEEAGAGQSLLSMAPHDHLLEAAERFGIARHFSLISGTTGSPGDIKAAHLVGHLEAAGVEAEEATLIGDTPDDAAAAAHVGASVVLYDGGSHHRNDLDLVGVPVASTLVEAVTVALSRRPPGEDR